jgi:hypothetical protein
MHQTTDIDIQISYKEMREMSHEQLLSKLARFNGTLSKLDEQIARALGKAGASGAIEAQSDLDVLPGRRPVVTRELSEAHGVFRSGDEVSPEVFHGGKPGRKNGRGRGIRDESAPDGALSDMVDGTEILVSN